MFRSLFLALFLSFFVALVVSADDAVLLADGFDSLQARLDLIIHAKEEISISTYIFKDDTAGRQIIAALLAARARGVRVNLLIDDVNNGISKAAKNLLIKSGVALYRFNPVGRFTRLSAFKRMHDKLFIVDKKYMILGDRNIAKEYFALDQENRIGKDIYISASDSVDKADAYFKSLLSVKEILPAKISPLVTAAQEKREKDLLRFFVPSSIDPAWRANIHRLANPVAFYSDPLLKDSVPGVEAPLLEAVRKAKKSLVIENPYIVLTPEFKAALEEALRNNPPLKIEVLTNSSMSNDQKLMAAAWEKSKEYFRSIGVDVWEHRGSSQEDKISSMMESINLHAKTIVVDGEVSYVSSYNLDPRSQHLNREVLAVIDDKQFSQQLLDRINQEKRSAYIHSVSEGHTLSIVTQNCSLLFRLLARLGEKQL